jgi:oxygen-independent coproporphyrinogen-3 oxidase
MPEAAYLDALLADLADELDRAGGRPVQTVFFGGGTPSLFGARSIGRILQAVDRRTPLGDAEITLEANPGTVERGSFADYAGAGVNRISLGAQSFTPGRLEALGRIHTADDVWRALDELVCAGIDNFNIDLMYGLPGQHPDDAAADVAAALRARPAHISCYQLTIEPNTLFHHRPPTLPDEDVIADMAETAAANLVAAGYGRYEISAWAMPGRRCRHNENYWRYGDYLGVGAGAHGKLTDARRNVIERCCKRRYPADYMSDGQSRTDQRRRVPPAERAFEFLLNALRLTDGFIEAEFTARTGLEVTEVRSRLLRAATDGLLENPAPGRWRATPRGLLFLNDLQARFLPGRGPD